jgi:hypothetical protein
MDEHTTRILQGNSVMARPKVIKLTVAALKVAKRGEAPLDVIPTRRSRISCQQRWFRRVRLRHRTRPRRVAQHYRCQHPGVDRSLVALWRGGILNVGSIAGFVPDRPVWRSITPPKPPYVRYRKGCSKGPELLGRRTQ